METNPLHKVSEIKTFSSSIWPDEEVAINKLLATKKWILLGCASGTDRDGSPMHEWVLGKIVP
ncbi:hypothetical protein Xsto_03245 [Xenorhabdus stockiae]|uniref:Uncharacterized protein n=2 Tax=Xenorhabdus TaxID=626 RepID=A0A2D0KLA6_9GAMM|nr:MULTISPECIES: hypothetical protein [Xenorhabdus]MBC8946363.1 hypothetical protein [Xenorhabdus indica]MCC8380176.1 hypothetical protein [Xenorhabdus sp. PB30.3]PHM64221.1 hypothetical protein Xsto_03245 [Xenorhabdus stockiae]